MRSRRKRLRRGKIWDLEKGERGVEKRKKRDWEKEEVRLLIERKRDKKAEEKS